MQAHERSELAILGQWNGLAEDLGRQGPGEGLGTRTGDDDGRAHRLDRQVPQIGAVERDGRIVVGAPEPLGQGRAGSGARAHQSGHDAAAQTHAGGGVDEVAGWVRTRRGIDDDIADQGLDGGDAGDPPGSDPGAGHELHEVGERVQRLDEEGRPAVEGDELAGRDAPLQGGGGAGADDDRRQDHGGAGADGGEQGLRGGDPHSRVAHAGGGLGVAGGVDVLAADAAQHAQAGDDVGGRSGQAALLLALDGHAPVERLDEGADQAQDDRQSQQHEQPEPDVHADHEDTDDDDAHQRAGDVGDDVHERADGVGVGGDGGDDIATGDRAGDGARATSEPVTDAAGAGLPAGGPGAEGERLGEAAGQRADDAERRQGEQTGGQVGGQSPVQARVDDATQGGGDESGGQVGQGVEKRGHGQQRCGTTQEGAHPRAGPVEDGGQRSRGDGQECRPAARVAGDGDVGGVEGPGGTGGLRGLRRHRGARFGCSSKRGTGGGSAGRC